MRITKIFYLKSFPLLFLNALCHPAEASLLYASPKGRITASCALGDPCSLTKARDRARVLLPMARGDVTVLLTGGTYELSAAFTLDERDAGKPGVHMVYQAAPGQDPILSGGRKVEGWKLSNADRGIWYACVPRGLNTRQIYVDGVRAIRARGQTDPGGFVKTAGGFQTSADLGWLAGSKGLEVVSEANWKEYRCPVDSVSNGEITLAQPCWTQSQGHSGFTMDKISWFENAYCLLDEAGEWYLDVDMGRLYYKPRANENMRTARVVAPVLESLLIARGTADRPLFNLRISGLTFAHSTWMQPSTPKGFPDLQSTYQYGDDGYGGEKIPSSVAFWFADSLVLERNVFTALGGNGPALEAGCRNSRISGNRLFDISGNGLHIGNITAIPDYAREYVTGITIDNNSVTQIGQEYHGASGIFLGYVARTRVLHNEINDVPYTGISLGWGWGRVSAMKNNEVAFNHIHNHMRTLVDGGGIYTLGAQPGTRIHHNYVHNQAHETGALYPDQGSSYLRWDSNVVQGVNRWFFMSNGDMYHNAIVGNYSDTREAVIIGFDCQVDSNEVISDGRWPLAALEIMAQAGLEARFLQFPQPTNTFVPNHGGERKAPFVPPSHPAKSKASLKKAAWQWVAPFQARNLLGVTLGH